MRLPSSPRSARRWGLAGGAGLAALFLVVMTLVAARLLPGGGGDPGSDSAEAGFARDMAIHHQQAVEMSFIVRDRTDDDDVRRLAYDIINTQANQRGMMLALLESWDLSVASDRELMAWMEPPMEFEPHDGALMPGMATDTQLEELRAAEGTAAEVLYLRLMTEHHRSGVHMAQAAARQAADDVVVRLAEGMVAAQESEIQLMTDMLAARGADGEGDGASGGADQDGGHGDQGEHGEHGGHGDASP